MDEHSVTIPYFVHEGEMARMERVNKKWFIAFLIVLVMLFLTNAGWIIYENQFDTYTYEQEVRTEQSQLALLNNIGEGSINYNGNGSEAAGDRAGQENQHQ